MNSSATLGTDRRIADFVTAVREHLADLDDEVRDELVGGLEADLSEQAADGARPVDLDDAAGYAAELRSAAGLPPARRRRLPRPGAVPPVGEALDRARAWFLTTVTARRATRAVWDVVRDLRPVWWVARAWIAVTALDVALGPWEPVSLVPSLGHLVVGATALGVAVVVSVLVGRGLWPGSGPDRAAPARLLTLVVNVAAALAPLTFGIAAPGYLVTQPFSEYGLGYADGAGSEPDAGLRLDGRAVSNVFAYDAEGQPLGRVQLFDQDGEPLSVSADAGTGRGEGRRVPCPVLNGTTALLNVFPLDQAAVRRGTCDATADERLRPERPLAAVPPL